jgi:hypothetical protein
MLGCAAYKAPALCGVPCSLLCLGRQSAGCAVVRHTERRAVRCAAGNSACQGACCYQMLRMAGYLGPWLQVVTGVGMLKGRRYHHPLCSGSMLTSRVSYNAALGTFL